MSFVKNILGDLRDKRFVAIAAAVLVLALIATPILLSNGASTPATVAQVPATSGSAPAGVPVVNSGSTPAGGRLSGHERDPFTQSVHGTKTGTSSTGGTSTTSTAGTSTTPSSGASTTSGGGSASTGGSTNAASGTAPAATIPTGTPKPAPPGLKPTQSYDVKFAITNASGGVDTTNPLERLSVLPSKQQPLLVELGVLKGGNRVLFAIEPGAVVSGAGTCIPGPIDCEILSLPQDQTVTLGTQSPSGIQTVALFAVTGITAANHSSVADANKVRGQASADGRALLNASSSSVLPLFQYEPSIGAIVDLRNLTVGG